MVEPAVQPNAIESGYQRILELGRGGTARVYLAKSTKGLRRLVVLKTLEPELATNTEMRELFRREAEVCARLNHPNIVQVQEVLEESTGPVIVMEYLEGIALSQAIVRSEGRLSKRLHLHAITQLLSGLHYFHELRDYDRSKPLNAIHRDVSPQNVILLYEGAVKVLDFGIAKLSTESQTTKTGIVKGKLHYMPAEQLLSDEAIDRRADIFAGGVMLWEALAERRMWHGHTDNTVMRMLINGKLPNLREVSQDYPTHFYETVSRATSFDPKARHPTALELQIDVERILDDLGGPVSARELSDFMQSEFAEYRQKRQAAIEAAVRQSLPPVPAPSDAQEAISTKNQHRGLLDLSRSDVVSTQSHPRKKNVILVTVIVSALLALVVGAFARTQTRKVERATTATSSARPPEPVPSATPAATTSVAPAASDLNDGQALGKAPNSAVHTSVEAKHAKKPAKPAVSVAKPERPPPAVSAPNCSPPYTLSSDGIRVYKAECFSQ